MPTTQPSAITLSNADLPATRVATLDAEKWWVINLPTNAAVVTLDLNNTLLADVVLVWSFDQTITNNDATPDWIGTTDGTIHDMAGAGWKQFYGNSMHTIQIPAAHDTEPRPFQIAVGVETAVDKPISVMVS